MKINLIILFTFLHFVCLGQASLFQNNENKTILDYNITNDTLRITFEYYKYDFGSPFITCAVMNCTDDHRTYFRERYFFYIKDGEEKFLYKEVGSEQLIEKTTTTKEWVFTKSE